jgi:GNAT superfamily N-acetyltransferase
MRWFSARSVTTGGKRKMLIYTEEKKFTKEQVRQLFLSVHWVSGNYPDRLYQALMHSSTVLTVWDGEQLAGLARVLDDSAMLAQIHYVLVHPDYQGQGIAGRMIEYIKDKYKDFMYIEGMPEDRKNVPFYEKHGFSVMKNGAAIQICNYDSYEI